MKTMHRFINARLDTNQFDQQLLLLFVLVTTAIATAVFFYVYNTVPSTMINTINHDILRAIHCLLFELLKNAKFFLRFVFFVQSN